MSNYDLSQFYTRRNSNYKVPPELAKKKSISVVNKYNGDETCVLTESGTAIATVNSTEAGRNICGFLFSVSKSQKGEYWTIKTGVNTIGSSETCDIRLEQNSVKDIHAMLTISNEKGELDLLIEGDGHIQINGHDISEPTVCRDRDILTIGDIYQLLILCADSMKYGLRPSKEFNTTTHVEEDPTTNNTTIIQSEEGTVFI